MAAKTDLIGALESHGFCWLRGALNPHAVTVLKERLDQQMASGAGRTIAAGHRIAQTNTPAIIEVLQGAKGLRPLLISILGEAPLLVRALIFDKSPAARWYVPWHRDTMIPVQTHRPSSELTAPSTKEGVPHVRATARILENMLSLRLHLDPMRGDNGPLRVVPGSHLIRNLEDAPGFEGSDAGAKTCLAEEGDVMCMRPLLLHSSSRPESDRRRRILHLELARAFELPDGHSFFSPVPFFEAS